MVMFHSYGNVHQRVYIYCIYIWSSPPCPPPKGYGTTAPGVEMIPPVGGGGYVSTPVFKDTSYAGKKVVMILICVYIYIMCIYICRYNMIHEIIDLHKQYHNIYDLWIHIGIFSHDLLAKRRQEPPWPNLGLILGPFIGWSCLLYKSSPQWCPCRKNRCVPLWQTLYHHCPPVMFVGCWFINPMNNR